MFQILHKALNYQLFEPLKQLFLAKKNGINENWSSFFNFSFTCQKQNWEHKQVMHASNAQLPNSSPICIIPVEFSEI